MVSLADARQIVFCQPQIRPQPNRDDVVDDLGLVQPASEIALTASRLGLQMPASEPRPVAVIASVGRRTAAFAVSLVSDFGRHAGEARNLWRSEIHGRPIGALLHFA